MSVVCVLFLCSILLGAFVIAWIAYCMFYRERHLSEKEQLNIDDLRHKNMIATLPLPLPEAKEKRERSIAGIFVLPSRRKHQEYSKRPDYPESPAPPVDRGTADLVAMYGDSLRPDDTFQDASPTLHSDV